MGVSVGRPGAQAQEAGAPHVSGFHPAGRTRGLLPRGGAAQCPSRAGHLPGPDGLAEHRGSAIAGPRVRTAPARRCRGLAGAHEAVAPGAHAGRGHGAPCGAVGRCGCPGAGAGRLLPRGRADQGLASTACRSSAARIASQPRRHSGSALGDSGGGADDPAMSGRICAAPGGAGPARRGGAHRGGPW
ncbi:hypothetical protein D9M68_775700 [compost metagenome]